MSRSNRRRSGNPARRAAAPADPPSATRGVIAQRSRGLLVRLSKLPPLVVPGLMLVLMLLGLAAPLYVALPALAIVALFVGWLAFLSWPVLDLKGRFTRGLMLGLVLGAGVARATGWL